MYMEDYLDEAFAAGQRGDESERDRLFALAQDAPQRPIMATCAKESLSSRIWRTLGFGMNSRMDMVDWRCEEEPDFAPGALITDTVAHLDFLDRLRVLVSGRVRVEVSTKTDVLVKKSKSMAAVGVMPPVYPIPGKR